MPKLTRASNVQTLEAMYDAFNAGDIDAVLEFWEPDCEWRPAFGPRLLGENLYLGHRGFRKYFAEVSDTFPGYQTVPVRYDKFGDELICHAHSTGRGRSSGITISQRFAIHYSFREGRIARGQTYSDVGEAMSAVAAALADKRTGSQG